MRSMSASASQATAAAKAAPECHGPTTRATWYAAPLHALAYCIPHCCNAGVSEVSPQQCHRARRADTMLLGRRGRRKRGSTIVGADSADVSSKLAAEVVPSYVTHRHRWRRPARPDRAHRKPRPGGRAHDRIDATSRVARLQPGRLPGMRAHGLLPALALRPARRPRRLFRARNAHAATQPLFDCARELGGGLLSRRRGAGEWKAG